jgi:GNAT superfamily N-acetyltransferase
VNLVSWPDGFSIEQLNQKHKRKSFRCGIAMVDDWLIKRARQSQSKRLSVTKVLLKQPDMVAGYYTLAIGQVSFDALPQEFSKKLPSTLLPILTLAWLGVDQRYQGQGFGQRLLAQALADCYRTGEIMPFVAVLLDCASLPAKSFYQQYDFEELPGHPMKLMLPWKLLKKMMT